MPIPKSTLWFRDVPPDTVKSNPTLTILGLDIQPPLPSMKDHPRIYRQRAPVREPVGTEKPEEPERLRPDVFRVAKRLVDEEKLPENRISVASTMDAYHPMAEV